MLYQKKKKKEKGWLWAAVLTGLLLIAGCRNDGSAVILTGTEKDGDSEAAATSSATRGETEAVVTETFTTAAVIYVHICGSVVTPGVYELPEGSRVWDAVEAAGGFLEKADSEAINLALSIADGCKITIPAQGQAADEITSWYQVGVGSGTASGNMGSSAVGANTGLVDINRADVTTLMTIPGIGQVRAEAIVAYRKTQGPFEAIEEIMEVTGIKEGLFAQIREHITVGG